MKNALALLLLIFCITSCRPTSGHKEGPWWTENDRQHILSELDRTSKELREEVEGLSESQWHFRESADRWSIEEIVEHLEMQNQLHFREISVVANAPQYLQYRDITKGQDAHFTQYATDATPGQSQWFLEPLGRFKSMGAWNAFWRARSNLRSFVKTTEIDLRKQFTFRTPMEGKKLTEISIGQVRDLHQLLLTGIAHTDRHLTQIRKIKEHLDYPQ